MAVEDKIFVNVPTDAAGEARIKRQELFWTGPKLVVLTFVALGIALVILYLAAQTTSQTTWDDWLMPY